MNTFIKGILVGVGVGLLIAPLSGRETRRLLAERVREWRDALPPDSPVNQYAAQVSDYVTSARENWRGYAQQAVSKAKDTGSTFGNKAMRSGQDMAQKAKQASQDMAQKAKQAGQDIAHRAKQGAGYSSSSPNGASTRVVSEVDE